MDPRRLSATALIRLATRVVSDRRGATAVEYGLIIGLIVIVLITGLTQLASTNTGMWNNVSSAVIKAH